MSKSDIPNKVLLRSQTENTLVNKVFHLVNGAKSDCKWSDIDNLNKFILAIVMFDRVDLPTASVETAQTNIPDVMRNAELFNIYPIVDYEANLRSAEISVENSLNYLQLKYKRNMPEIGSDASDLDKQYTWYIDKLFAMRGFDPYAYWKDCKKKTELNEWDAKKFHVVESAFARPRYEELDLYKKYGIYQLWRTFNNHEISTSTNAVYINNHVRTPFVAYAYESVGNHHLREFFSGEFCLDSLPKRRIAFNLNKDYLIKRTVPLFLNKVLEKSKGERKRIPEAILEVRQSAEQFRARYREILEKKYGSDNPLNVTEEISKDIDKILSILHLVADKHTRPLSVFIPFSQIIAAAAIAYRNLGPEKVKEGALLASLAMLSVALKKYYDLRHLWLFSPAVISNYDKDLGEHLQKTFGEIK